MSETPNQLTVLLNEIRNRTTGDTDTATGSPAQAPTPTGDTPWLSVTTQKGEQVTFVQEQGEYYAQVTDGRGTVKKLSVRSKGDIPQILAALARYNSPGYRAA